MPKAYVMVEGQGEVEAVGNLLNRLWTDLGLPYVVWAKPKRRPALHTRTGILNACDQLRSEPDCAFALLLRDQDDGCPAKAGPETAAWVASAQLPFPVAVVLAHREFEAWFLPCLHLMAGREIRSGVRIASGAAFSGDPASARNVKKLISQHLPPGIAYKPTLDQLKLTQWLDFPTLRASQAHSFHTLERALRFLASPGASRVYPPPSPG